MAEVMDLDCVLTEEETNTDKCTKSDATTPQEKTTDEPQVAGETLEKPIKCEPLVEEKSPPNQVSIDETDHTNNIKSEAMQGTTMDECQVPHEKLGTSKPTLEDTSNQEPSNETSVMDKQEPITEEKEAGPQILPQITESATEHKESNEDQNIPNDSQDIPMEESTTSSEQHKFDMSINSDCELIADNVLTVDLTMDDSVSQATPLEQSNLGIKQRNVNQNLRDETVTEELKVDESSTEQVKSAENESVNPRVEGNLTMTDSIPQATPLNRSNLKTKQKNVNQDLTDKNMTGKLNADDSSTEQVESSLNKSLNPQVKSQNNSIHLIAQSGSGVESEKVNEKELTENEVLRYPQVDSCQNDSTLSLHSIADQNETDTSIEGSVVNETSSEQINLEMVPEKINQNIEDVPLNTNKSSNNKSVSARESKQNQSNNASDKTDLKETKTQSNTTNKNKRRQCPTCLKYHIDTVCWHATGAQKRDTSQLPEAPAPKKQKAESKYPADMVSLIAKQIHSPPDMSAWTKLTLIKECRILYLNHLPKSWSHNELKEFMKNNVECINETQEINEICFFLFVRDEKFNYTGECLIKFMNSDYVHKTWFDLRGAKIENRPVSVELDLGHNIMRQVRKDRKMRTKLENPAEEPTINAYETVKQKHAEVVQQKSQENENVASNINVNKSSASNNSQTDSAGTSNASQNYDRNTNSNIKVKPAYMPPEKFDNTTYGLNEGFLQSLGLRVPLCNVIIVLGLDYDVDDDKIKEVFSLAGTVKRAFRVLKKDGGPTMKGIVEYDHPVEAVQAVSMFHCKPLNGRNLIIKMAPKSFARPLPLGLTEVGPGLGHEGEPMRGVRPLIELQGLKKMLMDFKNTVTNKITEMEKSIASLNKSVAILNAKQASEQQRPRKAPTPPRQAQPSEAATQLVNALSSLAQPNVLMGLTNLLSAQGLAQQGMGADQASMANAVQNQMMMQNAAYAQNVNMQGMPQPTLAGTFAQPGLAQTGLAQPGLAHPGLAQPGLVQPQMIQPMEQSQMFYGQPQMMQPGYITMPTVPSPAPVPAAPQITPQPVASQQTQAYTLKVPEKTGPSKSQATSSNWNVTPVTAPEKRKAVEPKPAYAEASSHYKRPSRFDMKEKPTLKVIEPEPEKKNDLLVFSNLPSSVSVQALNSKMREVGDVMFGEMTGRGRALVRFKHPRDAERCIKLFNRSKVDGQVITVEYF